MTTQGNYILRNDNFLLVFKIEKIRSGFSIRCALEVIDNSKTSRASKLLLAIGILFSFEIDLSFITFGNYLAFI